MTRSSSTFNLRRLTTLSILIVVPFFLTGCGLKNNNTSKISSGSNTTQTLTIWRQKGSTNAEEQAFTTILKNYAAANPTVQINYRTFKPEEDYEKAVLNGLAAGNGPDVWEIRNDELPRHKDKLYGVDSTDADLQRYKATFANVINEEMVSDKKLYGLPLALDPLVLFINTDHLKTANIQDQSGPKTWKDLTTLADKLTVKANGIILRPGFAMGTASNIDRASDIVQMMMLQFNTQMVDPAHKTATFELYTQDPETKAFEYPGKTAFALYASFANPQASYQSWNASQAYTTQLFAQGNLSMMINYLSVGPQMLKLNPKLNVEIVRVPQWITKKIPVGDLPAEVSEPVYTAKYKALVASKPSVRLSKAKQTQQITLAWGFINYAAGADNITTFTQASGLLSPRLGVNSASVTSSDIESDIVTHLKTWYKGPSPRSVDKIFFDMTQAITEQRKSANETFTAASQAVTKLLQ